MTDPKRSDEQCNEKHAIFEADKGLRPTTSGTPMPKVKPPKEMKEITAQNNKKSNQPKNP